MLTSEQLAEIIFNSFKIVWGISEPILTPIVLTWIVASLIRKLITSVSYNSFRISGDSKTMAKKKTKKIAGMFDLISATNDLNRNLK